MLARETAADARPHVSSTGADVELRLERNGSDRVLVQIRDRGTGIRTKDLAQIFEPYFTTRRSGTGLGLPIARSIVEGLGGTLGHTDGRGGTTIDIDLPARPRSRGLMTSTGSILLVDDEEKILKTLGRALRTEGHRVVERSNAREARRLITDESFDVLIVDNLMPGMTGLELIRDVVRSTPERDRPQIVMMTAHATVADAIAAMKLGALDFLQKPFEIDHLLVTINRAVDHQRLRTEHRYLLSERDEEFSHYGIVGRSRTMQDVIHRAERVAETKSTVLITGETGTGKELVARAIHDRSAERRMPLVKVNCAAHPGDAAGIGAVRPRARRVHRRDVEQAGPLRAGQRRHASSSTRSATLPAAAAGQAAARAAGARVRAARRRARPSTSTCA